MITDVARAAFGPFGVAMAGMFAGILIVALSAVLSTAWRPLLGVAAIAAVAVAIAEVFLIRGGS